MPEGDSIRKYAARLRPVLVGQTLERFEMRERGPIGFLAGRAVNGIDVHGKHMMIAMEPDWVLRIHLGMKGRWSVYMPGQRWGFPKRDARVVLATAEQVAVCFRASTAELTRARDPRLRERLRALGPDVLAEGFEPAVAAARARARAAVPIGEVLLDQRVAAGIGNVYRSEILFITGVLPTTRVSELDDDALTAIYAKAVELMRSNMVPGGRSTAGAFRGRRRSPEVARFYVYRRRGLPCHRCNTPIERGVMGDLARSVYFCPRCQKQSL